MFTLELFETFARYNRWMNEKLFAICAGMSDEERKRDLRAPFHSIHGTFNHLLLADRIWLSRFQQQEFHFQTLADELYHDFNELRNEQIKTDYAIDAWLASLSESQLADSFTYHNRTRNQDNTFLLSSVMLHFFNHQTHHRGQITAMIEMLGYDCGVTDLLRLPGLEKDASWE
jgi:uncharacterized damage-inducible protein DinB